MLVVGSENFVILAPSVIPDADVRSTQEPFIVEAKKIPKQIRVPVPEKPGGLDLSRHDLNQFYIPEKNVDLIYRNLDWFQMGFPTIRPPPPGPGPVPGPGPPHTNVSKIVSSLAST